MIERVISAAATIAVYTAFLWWFFFSQRTVATARLGKDLQELDVTVRGGYSPDVLVVKEGIPVRINFKREETADCSDRVTFGDFNISKKLPAYKTTPVEFVPYKAGEFRFTCGMGMYQGKIIVQRP